VKTHSNIEYSIIDTGNSEDEQNIYERVFYTS